MIRFFKLFFCGLTFVLSSVSLALPMTDLLGDKDCFGTGAACVEDGTTWVPGAWTSVSHDPWDPDFTDTVVYSTSDTQSWTHTHTIAAGSYGSAFLTLRTAGIADVKGPYEVYIDGMLVGEMPLDGYGHILVETFVFAFDGSLLNDGSATVSFSPLHGDTWAIDYSEITYDIAAISEPSNTALFAIGILSLGLVRRRQLKQRQLNQN